MDKAVQRIGKAVGAGEKTLWYTGELRCGRNHRRKPHFYSFLRDVIAGHTGAGAFTFPTSTPRIPEFRSKGECESTRENGFTLLVAAGLYA